METPAYEMKVSGEEKKDTTPLLPNIEGSAPLDNDPLVENYESKKVSKFKRVCGVLLCMACGAVPIIICCVIIAVIVVELLLNMEFRFYSTLNWPANQSLPGGEFYTTSDGLHVLSLTGNGTEMGYAYGSILGELMVNCVDYLAMIFMYNTHNYEKVATRLFEEYDTESFYAEEFRAYIQAVDDLGIPKYVNKLERDWELKDMWLLNTIYDWNVFIMDEGGADDFKGIKTLFSSLACSSVGIPKEFSQDGKPILTRILDFSIDPKAVNAQGHLMTIWNNEIFSFGFVGILGTMTGFNSAGVWISNDNSNGLNDYKNKPPKFTPMMLLARKFLEDVRETDKPIDGTTLNYYTSDNHHFIDSFLYFIGNRNHSFVLEQLKQDIAVRGETDDYVILTNHLRVLQGTPKDTARYVRYTNYLEGKKQAQEKVDWEDVLEIQVINQLTTLLCVQFYPVDLEFRVGFAKVTPHKEGGWWELTYKGCEDPLFVEKRFKMSDFFRTQ